jgi:hypothetical protein
VGVVRKVFGTLAFPVKRYFDPRFRSLHEHVDTATEHHVLPRVDGVQHAVDDLRGRLVDQLRHDLIDELENFKDRVASDTQVAAEYATTFRRATDRHEAQLHAIWMWLLGSDSGTADLYQRAGAGDREAELELAKLLRDSHPGLADRVVGAMQGAPLPIGPGTADFLNWAQGHAGPAAQAGMWFNPALGAFHHDGTVVAGEVNERIVELPFALGVAANLQPGDPVLDFGATESTLSLQLASLGLDVTAADLRPYPLTHPRLRTQVGPIEQWEGPARPLAAIFSISALEHVGLGAYDETPTEDGSLDRQIVERFASWLRPGGQFVLTAPYGRWSVDELQRVYDRAHLDELLAGWTILDRAVCVQTGPSVWERVDAEPDASTWDDGRRGVVLVRATPDQR